MVLDDISRSVCTFGIIDIILRSLLNLGCDGKYASTFSKFFRLDFWDLLVELKELR